MPISIISIHFTEMIPKQCGWKQSEQYLVKINTRKLPVIFLLMI